MFIQHVLDKGRGALLYKNTPVNPAQFDSMVHNGYIIDNIDAPNSTNSPIILDLGAGTASMTPPLEWYWRLLMVEALGLTVQTRVV